MADVLAAVDDGVRRHLGLFALHEDTRSNCYRHGGGSSPLLP
jgi:hypothetical protein